MDGVQWLRRKIGEGSDKKAQDALHQHSKGTWNELLKAKDRQNKIALSFAGASWVITLVSVCGSVYLGTLPKSDVEFKTLDPMGYSLAMYTRDILSASEKDAMRKLLVEKFVRDLRETYPNDKGKQERAVMSAGHMALPNSLAFKKGVDLFHATKPYERMKKERVTIGDMSSNRVGDATWHLQFKEIVQGLTTQTSIEKTCTSIVTTESRNDIDSKLITPMGLFVVDFSFDDRCS